MDNDKSQNPYAAPSVDVLTAQADAGQESLIPGGRGVGFGQGLAWIGQGWSLFTQAPLIWVVNVVIFIAIFVVASLIPFIGTLIGYVLTGLFAGGLMLGAHAQQNGRPLEVADVFSGFKAPMLTPLLIIGVLYMAAWLVVIVIAGIMFAVIFGASGAIGALMSGDSGAMAGLLAGAGLGVLLVGLVVMALSVPIVMAMWFAPALVVLQNMAPVEAMTTSFRGCLRNILPFLLYGIVFLILFIIGSLPFLLGLLVVLPLLYTSTYAAYRDIFLGDDR